VEHLGQQAAEEDGLRRRGPSGAGVARGRDRRRRHDVGEVALVVDDQRGGPLADNVHGNRAPLHGDGVVAGRRQLEGLRRWRGGVDGRGRAGRGALHVDGAGDGEKLVLEAGGVDERRRGGDVGGEAGGREGVRPRGGGGGALVVDDQGVAGGLGVERQRADDA